MQDKILFPQQADQSVGFMFWQATNLWQQQIAAALKPLGLTHVQFVVLAVTAWLNQQHGEVTQAMVAQQAKIDVMMTSKVVRTLVEKELLKRVHHTTDERAYALSLTIQGLLILPKALEAVDLVDTLFFASVASNRHQFLQELATIINNNQARASSPYAHKL